MNKKRKINLYWDKWNFGNEERAGHLPSTPSQYIEWTNDPTDVAIFVDYDGSLDNLETIVKNSNQKYKVMVQMEPMSFNRALHSWILENEHLFDLIFVHYPAWKGTGKYPEKYKYYIAGSRTFIDSNERKIYNKSKNVTAIWSNKNLGLQGHILRHTARDYIKNKIPKTVDWNNPVKKIDVLKDYRYEIVVENEFPYFLTEKHLDCMLTGTIPIIWGHKDTKQWEGFNTDGMIFFNTAEELYDILTSNKLTSEFYNSKEKEIKHNFKECFKHLSFGDIIWRSGLSDLLKSESSDNLTIDFNLDGGGTLSQLEVMVKSLVHNPKLLKTIEEAPSIYIKLGEHIKSHWLKDNKGLRRVPNWFDFVFDQSPNENNKVLNLYRPNLCNDNYIIPCTNLITNKRDKDLLPIMRKVVNTLCKWKPSLINDVNNYYKKWKLDSNTLGVHLRTTDMNLHTEWGKAELSDYLILIRKVIKENPNINKIFIASDAVKSIEYLKTFSDLPPIYYFNIERVDLTDQTDSQVTQQILNWEKKDNAYELFRDVHMLSKFPIFIGRISSVTNFSIILNENIKKYYCINEFFNDHNELEKERRKYVKTFLPSGGWDRLELSEEEIEKFAKIND